MPAGANWNNGVNAGSRAVNVNNQPWNVNTNTGVRLACENHMKPTAVHYGGGRSDRLSDHRSSPGMGETMLAPHLRVRRSFTRRPI